MMCYFPQYLISPPPPSHPLPFSYLVNGNSRVVAVPNMSVSEVKDHVSRLRISSGVKTAKLKKYWHTERPTIQGNWSPFLNK